MFICVYKKYRNNASVKSDRRSSGLVFQANPATREGVGSSHQAKRPDKLCYKPSAPSTAQNIVPSKHIVLCDQTASRHSIHNTSFRQTQACLHATSSHGGTLLRLQTAARSQYCCPKLAKCTLQTTKATIRSTLYHAFHRTSLSFFNMKTLRTPQWHFAALYIGWSDQRSFESHHRVWCHAYSKQN